MRENADQNNSENGQFYAVFNCHELFSVSYKKYLYMKESKYASKYGNLSVSNPSSFRLSLYKAHKAKLTA